MGIHFIVKSSSGGGDGETPSYGPNNPPTADGWYDMTDDTYWESPSPVGEGGVAFCSWNGSVWVTNYLGMYDINSYNFELNPKSGTTWANGFRPSQIRVTHTSSDPFSNALDVKDISQNTIGTGNFSPSPVTIGLSFGESSDIYTLSGGDDNSSYTLTKIEFYIGSMGG